MSIGSYLLVRLELQKNEDPTLALQFAQYMYQLYPNFTKGPYPGWDLCIAAVHDPVGDARDPKYQDTDTLMFLHLWRIRDYNTLPYLMRECNDDETYRVLDNMVLVENQDFCGAVNNDPGIGTDISVEKGQYLLCVTTKIKPLVQNDFLKWMIKNCNPMRTDWELLHASYAQTGLLRRYFHIWRYVEKSPYVEPDENDIQQLMCWLRCSLSSFLDSSQSSALTWEQWKSISYTQPPDINDF